MNDKSELSLTVIARLLVEVGANPDAPGDWQLAFARAVEREVRAALPAPSASECEHGECFGGKCIHADDAAPTTDSPDKAEVSRIAEAAPSESKKLWLWKNFVDGRPEYWAFDNPYPIHLTFGDPQTLGEPCGYAIFKESRAGRTDVPEEKVIAAIVRAAASLQPTPPSVREWADKGMELADAYAKDKAREALHERQVFTQGEFDVNFTRAALRLHLENPPIDAGRPHVLMRPAISIDGDKYCALYGENLQDGVAGFGDSPYAAMCDFDVQWNTKLSRMENPPAQQGWQEIESAPKDGQRVMLTCAGYVGTNGPFSPPDADRDILHLARFTGDFWEPFIPNEWTHWMPLPSPPPSLQGKAKEST